MRDLLHDVDTIRFDGDLRGEFLAPWVIPAIIAVVGGIAESRKSNKTIYESGHPLYPGSEPANPALRDQITGANLGGGGGGGGGMNESTSMMSSLSKTIQDMTQTPFLTPEYAGLGGSMKSILEGRLASGVNGGPSPFGKGYLSTQTANINDQYGLARKALENRLTASGAAGSPGPTEAGLGYLEANRGRDVANLRGNLPLLDRQLQDQDLSMAAQLAQVFGLGQKQHTEATTQTTQKGKTTSTSSGGGGGGGAIIPPNILPDAFYQAHQGTSGGGLSDTLGTIGGMLAMLYGLGVFGGGNKQPKAASTKTASNPTPVLIGGQPWYSNLQGWLA